MQIKRRKSILIIFVLIFLFLFLRLAVLFSYLDKLYEPEELYRGTIAREIIQGPLIPLWDYLDYKIEYFSGGVLTVGILAVPFFLLFGQTYISLKLVGLSFALGTFILWYLFLNKFFTRTTAIVSSLLFIFCMPFYTMMSLLTWGQHPEANLFTILSIFIFYTIFFKEEKITSQDLTYLYKNNKMQFFFLGLVAGFSLWFVQTYLLTIIFILSFWFIFDKKFLLKKPFYILCFGFLLGFSPNIYYALVYGGEVFSINGRNLLWDIISCDLKRILPKMSTLLTHDLPCSFLFEDFLKLDGKIISYTYYLVFIVAFLYLLWFNRRDLLILFKGLIYPITLREVKVIPSAISKESLLLVYPLLFFLGYSLSNYSIIPKPWKEPEVWRGYIGFRYMIPVIPFILAILAILLVHIQNRKALFKIFLSFILILGLIGNFSLISPKNLGRFNDDKGYSYNIIGRKIGLRITQNLKDYIRPFDKLEDGLRLQFYEGLGSGIAWRLRNSSIDEVIKVFKKEIEERYQPCLYKGWGSLLYPEYSEEIDKAFYIANNIVSEYRPFFYEGLGKKIVLVDNMKKTIDLINKIDKAYLLYCYVGLGHYIGFRFKNDINKQGSLLDMVDKEYQKFVHKGILEGMRDR